MIHVMHDIKEEGGVVRAGADALICGDPDGQVTAHPGVASFHHSFLARRAIWRSVCM